MILTGASLAYVKLYVSLDLPDNPLVDVSGAAMRRSSRRARRRSAAGDWKAIGGDFQKAIKAVERTEKITWRGPRHEGAN
jgi:hypothetical protein